MLPTLFFSMYFQLPSLFCIMVCGRNKIHSITLFKKRCIFFVSFAKKSVKIATIFTVKLTLIDPSSESIGNGISCPYANVMKSYL